MTDPIPKTEDLELFNQNFGEWCEANGLSIGQFDHTRQTFQSSVNLNTLKASILDLLEEQKKALLDLVEREVIGENIAKDWDDSFDSVMDWEYYDDYNSNAFDFVRGYNKAKTEQREKLNTLRKD